MKRIAIAGATGYIGGRLAPRLLEGYGLRCLVRSPRKLEGRDWTRDRTPAGHDQGVVRSQICLKPRAVGSTGLTAANMKDCQWLRPVLVEVIDFLEWTADNHRHTKFVALREDMPAKQIRRE